MIEPVVVAPHEQLPALLRLCHRPRGHGTYATHVSDPGLAVFLTRLYREMPWRDNGLCRRSNDRSRWFVVGEDEEVEWQNETINGRQAHILAVDKYCSECPVQYDCAMWALRHEEPTGVWGMTIRDMLWLQRFGGGELIIEYAKSLDEPIQDVVRHTRRCVNRSQVEAEEAADIRDGVTSPP